MLGNIGPVSQQARTYLAFLQRLWPDTTPYLLAQDDAANLISINQEF